MVLPSDTGVPAGYSTYNLSRAPATGLNIADIGAGAMLHVTPANLGGKIYGFHPLLGEIRLLFQGISPNPALVPNPAASPVAVVCNTGPLVGADHGALNTGCPVTAGKRFPSTSFRTTTSSSSS